MLQNFYKFLFISFTLLCSISARSEENSLVAHYPLNGNANDVSGYRNNGTAYNPIYVSDRFGNLNSAMYFGGDTYIDIPDNASLRPNKLSMSAWVLMSEKSRNANFIISKGYDGSLGHYGLNILSESEKSQAVLGQIGGIVSEVRSSQNIPLLTWTHICSVYDGTTLKIYINGVLSNVVLAIDNYKFDENRERLLIGRNDTNNSYYQYWFMGIMDDIQIYNKSLTDLEVATLYNTIASVDENKNNDIKLGKGSDNSLKIEIPTSLFNSGMSYQLYDINGRILKHAEITTTTEKISLPALANKSVYLLRVIDKTGLSVYTEKISL